MMQAEEKPKAKLRKKTWKKMLRLILVFAVVLVVLAFLLLPVFISSEKGRQIILARINNVVRGTADFAHLSMGWFKGIKIADFSFDDDAGRTSIRVRQITTKPHYGSILMGSLSFGQTIIDKPDIEINLKAEQPAVAPQQRVPTGEKPRSAMLPLKKIDLIVNDGSVKVTDRQARIVELSQINSKVDLRPPGRRTDFDVTLAVVDKDKQSQVHTAGHINPKRTKTGWSFEGTSGDFVIEVNDLDLESLAPFFTLAGLEVQAEGVVSVCLDSQIKDGRVENLNGIINATNLDVTAAGLKGDRIKTGTLDVDVKLSHKADAINIDKLQLKSDWADVTASGTVPTTFKSLSDFLQPDSNYDLQAGFDCDLAAVLSQMPETLGIKEGTEITAGRLNGNIQTSTEASQRKIQGRATLSELQGIIEGRQISLSQPIQAQTQISSDKKGIKFDELDVSSSFAKINCIGTAELLNFNADVDLNKFQSELGQFADFGPYQVAGELSTNGRLSITADKVSTIGSSTVKDFVIASAEATASEPAADMVFDFDIDRKNNLINIDSVETDAALGRVTVKDAVIPLSKKAAKSVNLSVSADNVNLRKLQPFLVLFASFPKQMQLEGTADSGISVSSEKEIYKVATDSTKIKNLKVYYPDQRPFEPDEVSLVFDAEVDPQQKTINVKKLNLQSPQIKIKKGRFEQVNKAGKIKLDGSVDCEYDWSAVGTLAGPFLPQGLKLQGKRTDTISFTGEYPAGQPDKILANLNTKTKLGFDKAEYKGLLFGPTEADIQIQNGLLNIAPFSSAVNNGRLNFAAQIDLRQKPMVLQTTGPMQIIDKVEINEQMSSNLLENLNPIFKDQAGITGIANFHSEKLVIPLGKDADVQPEIVGTVGIEKIKLQAKGLVGNILSRTRTASSIDAEVLPTKFVLRNSKLSYDNMQINLDKYPTNFGGSIGPRRVLNMKVVTPYILTEDFKLQAVKIGEKTTAERIKLALIGTIDRPELDWAKLTEELLKQQLKQRLQEGLEELLKKQSSPGGTGGGI
jgi:autotransporter translocation and assembly factor TamB